MAINRFSSRKHKLDQVFLYKELAGAKSYRRIAGYFRSSIFEIAQETLSRVGHVQIVCNADIDEQDLRVSQVAQAKLLGKWNDQPIEAESLLFKDRFKNLYELLTRKNIEIRVAPDNRCGFVHGKAGVIEKDNGDKIAFIGSLNETITGWQRSYEILWSDSSQEGIDWVEQEFAFLWQNSVPLPDVIVKEAKRCARRLEVIVPDIEDDETAPAALVESPMYREGYSLQPWQQGFVSEFLKHRKAYGEARLLLADEVGLGKTLSMATAALISCLLDERPVLILVPATLSEQWQTELIDKLGIPSGRYVSSKKVWVDHNERIISYKGAVAIKSCPCLIGIVSTGLITHNSEEAKYLQNMSFGMVVLDEAHKARRSGSLQNKKGKPNNLMQFMLDMSMRTKHVILGTATPIQTEVQDLFDTFEILANGREFVRGNIVSKWRNTDYTHRLLSGETTITQEEEAWDLLKNPLPPKGLSNDPSFEQLIDYVRSDLGLRESSFASTKGPYELEDMTRDILEDNLHRTSGVSFFQQHNPIVRHTILRKRSTLEEQGLLPRIGVNIHPSLSSDGVFHSLFEDKGLKTDSSFDEAYAAAEDFCKALGQRDPSAGLRKSLMLQRICSSCEAGLQTAKRLLSKKEEEGEDETLKLDPRQFSEQEFDHLKAMLLHLGNMSEDPKLKAIKYYLTSKDWLRHGCIIFSQYYDTARWIAEKLALHFPQTSIALYAGADKSRLFSGQNAVQTTRETIKRFVGERSIRLVVATDAACEGLNLQALGTLINVDLPWNPTKLEQRIGRIKRFGQTRKFVDMLNLVYQNTKDEDIYDTLSRRMHDKFDIFGSLPDVIDDEWIDNIENLDAYIDSYIERKKRATGFDIQYNTTIKPDDKDWRECEKVLSRQELERVLTLPWKG